MLKLEIGDGILVFKRGKKISHATSLAFAGITDVKIAPRFVRIETLRKLHLCFSE
jgi:hypothetical protein